ncbi:hypothetical protein E2562_031140 [Oryza meyeriana var. granulata]|uniref:RRM domain-containing protein n=1 Tax=Oryza meyeriana var. granulata TaxID=110450 RepID=A0A6G1DQ97_9ORYZ|nr:hypothetical protein E2562_031140 [Oryza meyeriana var. granulata]
MAEDGGDRGEHQHQQQQQQQQEEEAPQPPRAEAAGGGEEQGSRGEESVKLFVGQVPKQMTEEELAAMFGGVAVVDEVTLIRDKATKASRGCCFLICPSREEADKAVNAYHNKRTLPGASSPLQVKYADGELERLEHKLFIGMLPKNVSDAEMTDLFSQYGRIKDLQILRGSQQTSKAGCAFLKYETKEQAVAAIEALNGKHKIEGSSVPLVVKWADTEKERQARKAQKAQFHPSNMSNANAMQQSSLFGAMQMGYVPQYNGYGYQPQGTYGLMQYPLSPMQNQAAFQNMVQSVNQGSMIRGVNSELSPNSAPRSFNSMQLGSPYSPVAGMQYPGSYPGSAINSRPFVNSHNSMKVPNANASSPTSSTSSNPGPQIEGLSPLYS